jgi:hypothetical protein
VSDHFGMRFPTSWRGFSSFGSDFSTEREVFRAPLLDCQVKRFQRDFTEPDAAKLLILSPGSKPSCPENERICVNLTVPCERRRNRDSRNQYQGHCQGKYPFHILFCARSTNGVVEKVEIAISPQ